MNMGGTWWSGRHMVEWEVCGGRGRYIVDVGGTWWMWEVHGGHGRHMVDVGGTW